jgi:hypothetical protein
MTPLDRKAWLRDRQSGIGGTDISAICGIGFSTAQEVYAEKVGELSEDAALPIMRMGLALESHNADLYAERFLGPDDALLAPGLVRSASPDWQFATFDRIASIRRDGETDAYRVVELKYVRWFHEAWGDDGSDMIPDGYSIQTTWEHAVARSRYPSRTFLTPHLAALDSSGEQRVFTVPFSERLAGLLFEIANEFWQRVLRREEVGPDWQHPLQPRIVELLPIRPNTAVKLGEEVAPLVDEFERLTEIRRAGDAAAKQLRPIKDQFISLLGDHAKGVLPDGRTIRQTHVRRGSYVVKDTEYRTLKLLPAGKADEYVPEIGDEDTILPLRSGGSTRLPPRVVPMIEAGVEEILLPRKGGA